MKTLKLTMAVIALLLVGIAAHATSKRSTPSKSDVVNIYIDAVTKGNPKELEKVLDNDMQFNMQRGQRVNTLNKGMLLSTLANNTVAAAPLNTDTTVLQDDEGLEKVKIDFKYDGYVRTDVVTLNHMQGWEITSVTSSYK